MFDEATTRELAGIHGVSQMQASNICSHRKWRHLP